MVGVELRDIDKRYLRRQVGIVLLGNPFYLLQDHKGQHCFGKVGLRRIKHIYKALSIAAVPDVIKEFEQGYDTTVGERGVTLSGGQKQKVAMAGALILDSSILIFDDSLSAVDTETRQCYQTGLKKREHKRV